MIPLRTRGLQAWPLPRHLTLFALVLSLTVPVTGSAQADSLAAAARQSYREGVAAARAGDWASARSRMVRAATTWPAQPAYAFAAASASARLGDSSEAVAWLDRLAALGQWRDVRGDEDFARVLGSAAVEAAIGRLEVNRVPVPRSRIAFELADSNFFAEGIDADTVEGVWFVGSVRKGQVLRVDGAGRARRFAAGTPLDAVFGVRVDAGGRRLWVTTRATPLREGFRPGSAEYSAVCLFDLASEELLAKVVLPDSGGTHTLGDLAIAPDGSAYITDSEQPVIHRAHFDDGALRVEPWATHRLFRSLQGIVITDGGRTALVADYSHGLLAIDLASHEVRELPAPAGATTLGIDGLVWWRGALVGIQNGTSPARIVRLTLAPAGDRVERVEVMDRNLPVASEPTNGTLMAGRLYYVANSQWPLYDDDGRLRPGAIPAPTTILELPLEP